MARTIELTSELLPILNVGMYNSFLDPDNLFDFRIEELPGENKEEVDFDSIAYMYDVSQIVRQHIIEELIPAIKKYGVINVTVGKIVSPSSYNYSSDYIEIDLKASDDFCQNLREQIDEWRKDPEWEPMANAMIKETWGSCSGFISLMPQSVDEIYEFDDEERCTAEFLCFVLHYNEDKLIEYQKYDGFVTSESFQENFIESCRNQLEYEEYAELEDIYPEELWEMYCEKPDDLDALIWLLFDAGVVKYNDFPEENREDSAIPFLEWCKKNKYETVGELLELLN